MSAQSHIAPMLPLARTAANAGHEVVFATAPDAVAAVQRAGLKAYRPGCPLWRRSGNMPNIMGTGFASLFPQERPGIFWLTASSSDCSPAMLEELLPFARTWQPDLVIRNLGEPPAAEVVATAAGVPHVIHGFSSPKSSYFAPVLRAGLAELYEGGAGSPRRAATHVSPPPTWTSGPRVCTRTRRTGGARTCGRCGPRTRCRPRRPIPPRPTALDGLPFERTVYVTAGTTHNSTPGLLETMVAALHDEAVNLVVTMGPDRGPRPQHQHPNNVRVERSIESEKTILPHCEAVTVSNAGAGAVLGALAHGRPLVLAPRRDRWIRNGGADGARRCR